MQRAIAFEKGQENEEGKLVSAARLQRRFVQDGKPAADFLGRLNARYTLRAPLTGFPVNLQLETESRGRRGVESRAAHFKCAPGFGPDDHVYGRRRETLAEAAKVGKKFLFSLNADLSARMMDFSKMKGPGAQSVEDWITQAQNEAGYVSISVTSEHELRSKLRLLSQLVKKPAALRARTGVGYMGGVLEASEFFLAADRAKSLTRYYDMLAKGHHGAMLGQTRMIGFPKEISLLPTWNTANSEGRRLKFNHVDRDNDQTHYMMEAQFEDPRQRHTEAYEVLQSYFAQRRKGALRRSAPALVSGFIEVSREGETGGTWRITHLDMRDIERQFDVGAMERALRAADKERRRDPVSRPEAELKL